MSRQNRSSAFSGEAELTTFDLKANGYKYNWSAGGWVDTVTGKSMTYLEAKKDLGAALLQRRKKLTTSLLRSIGWTKRGEYWVEPESKVMYNLKGAANRILEEDSVRSQNIDWLIEMGWTPTKVNNEDRYICPVALVPLTLTDARNKEKQRSCDTHERIRVRS